MFPKIGMPTVNIDDVFSVFDDAADVIFGRETEEQTMPDVDPVIFETHDPGNFTIEPGKISVQPYIVGFTTSVTDTEGASGYDPGPVDFSIDFDVDAILWDLSIEMAEGDVIGIVETIAESVIFPILEVTIEPVVYAVEDAITYALEQTNLYGIYHQIDSLDEAFDKVTSFVGGLLGDEGGNDIVSFVASTINDTIAANYETWNVLLKNTTTAILSTIEAETDITNMDELVTAFTSMLATRGKKLVTQ